MNNLIKKELKYAFLIPIKDVRYLSPLDFDTLSDMIDRIDEYRKLDKRPPLSANKYIICNQDEPYAERVWQTILQGERDKMFPSDRDYVNDPEIEAILEQYPCPCCNGRPLIEKGYVSIPQINDKASVFHVICSDCGLQSDFVPYIQIAIDLWCNRI